jgi:hypothetical protein
MDWTLQCGSAAHFDLLAPVNYACVVCNAQQLPTSHFCMVWCDVQLDVHTRSGVRTLSTRVQRPVDCPGAAGGAAGRAGAAAARCSGDNFIECIWSVLCAAAPQRLASGAPILRDLKPQYDAALAVDSTTAVYTGNEHHSMLVWRYVSLKICCVCPLQGARGSRSSVSSPASRGSHGSASSPTGHVDRGAQ